MPRYDGQGPPKALVALCIATVLALGCQASFATIVVDLTTASSTGWANGAYFVELDPTGPTGTGVFDPFLRLQANGSETGLNTDGAVEFDTKSGIWTHSVVVGTLPAATIGGTMYAQFLMDMNETKNDAGQWLSLDTVKLYVANAPNLSYAQVLSGGTLVYDLDVGPDGDSWVKLNYALDNGSGSGDIAMYIPAKVFEGHLNQYLYFYTQMGMAGTVDGKDWSTDDGFEEWGLAAGTPIPEPSSMLLVGLALSGGALTKFRRRRRAA